MMWVWLAFAFAFGLLVGGVVMNEVIWRAQHRGYLEMQAQSRQREREWRVLLDSIRDPS